MDGCLCGYKSSSTGSVYVLPPFNTVSLLYGGSGKNSGALFWTTGEGSMNRCRDEIREFGRSLRVGGMGGPKASSTQADCRIISSLLVMD